MLNVSRTRKKILKKLEKNQPQDGSFNLSVTFLFYFILFYFILFYLFVWLFKTTPVVYGGSQSRGQIGATAAGLHYSHSSTGYELHLQPTPQLMTTLTH